MPRFDRAKICLVTGGACGLGRATALQLAALGNPVAIGDVQDEAGLETVRDIEAAGGKAVFRHLDVTNAAEVKEFVEHVVQVFGALDCAVNNAGVEGSRVKVADYPDEDWKRVMYVNLVGAFTCMKHELRAMTGRGGSIVNVGSTGSLRGVGMMSAYTASKHELAGLTKSAALEYAAEGVRVNCLCPGGFWTSMSDRLHGGDSGPVVAGTPMRRVAQADEIAAAIVWLCSDESTFVTGAMLSVDGGRMAAPVLAA